MNASQLKGFTDIHTHILPGADDGAKTLQVAQELVRMAWANGTRTIFLTPHYRGIFKKNTPAYLRQIFDTFRQTMEQAYPGLRLYLGNEVHYQAEVPERLADGKILTLADSQYVLLECQSNSLRSHVITGVSETIRCGFTPVIAHADRYEVFRADPKLTDEVLSMGALIQLNADSVMGANGLAVKRFCHRLLKAECVHFIASDAHDPEKRPPLLRECFLRVHKKYGAEYAAQVFYHNAQAIIENRTIE